MGEVVKLPVQEHSPSTADHLALKFLIKYLSQTHDVPYKTIAEGTGFNESTVKNYVNDKTTVNKSATPIYSSFVARCEEIISAKPSAYRFHEYAVHLLNHLFGREWLRSARIPVPAGTFDGQTPDIVIANWLGITDENIAHTESRFRGLWQIVRASSPTASQRGTTEVREVNYSLLNFRPRSVSAGKLCDFRWHYLGQGNERGEYETFEGFVIPNVNRIEFLARAQDGPALLTLMVWRFRPNREIVDHMRVTSGQALSLNTHGAPLSARVRAFFVEQSEQFTGRKFDALKRAQIDAIGVSPLESLRERIPHDQYEKTVRYLTEYRPIIGFFPSQDDTHEG